MATSASTEVEFGPAMSALTDLQRQFVIEYCDHPELSLHALAQRAGYAAGAPGSTQLRVVGSNNMHNEKVLEAINEEASKRLRSGGLVGVTGLMKMALNETHKDHFRACQALADRTGFHAMSEHKVTVDDKRPQTKQELIDAVRKVAAEAGLTAAEAEKLISAGTAPVEVKFTEIEPEINVEDL